MKGLKITGIIVAVVIGVFLIIGMTIDGMVKSGIEDSGSALLKTEVEVDDIDISIFGGSASMDGFNIYNPEGFSDNTAISLKGIEIELDIKSLFSETIIVKRIHVTNPEIFFEQKETRINLRELNNNLNAQSEDESEKALIIEKFILEKGKITISSELEKERTVEASIDRIELNNIGKDGSSTVQQALKEILEPIIQNAISEAIKSGLLDKLENTVKDLIDF
jgi:uncharacterized protein involved in outer membrane biogenesis